MPSAGVIGLACALLAGPVPANAQIVNTLRSWTDVEDGWLGDIEARFALAQGNTEYVEFVGGASIQVVASRHRLRGLFSGNLRSASGEKIAESLLGHVRHNYRLTRVVSTLVFVQHQTNPFRRLQRRTLAGAGTRLDLVQAEHWEGTLGLSYMVEAEQLTDDAGRGTETEGRGSFFLSAIGNITDDLRIDLSTFYQPLFSNLGDARAYSAASARIDIVGELDLVVRFDLTHDSRPPEGVEPTDLRFSTGLVLEF